MKLLALEIEIEKINPKASQQYLEEEAKNVWELQQEGFIREIYFRTERNLAVLVLEAKSKEEAKEKLYKLPLVKNGLIKFEIIPLRAYPGFERLFKK